MRLARTRALTSATEPAGNPTISRIGRVGKSVCASAGDATPITSNNARDASRRNHTAFTIPNMSFLPVLTLLGDAGCLHDIGPLLEFVIDKCFELGGTSAQRVDALRLHEFSHFIG